MADRKDIHVDLLAIDMETGQYWLDPSQKQSAAREKIRKRNRDKWLAEQKAEAEKAKAAKTKSYEMRAEGEHEEETEQTEVELWPEEGEKRSEFMDRCVVELEKCIGDRAEEVCDEKWHQSRTLGTKGFVTVKLTGDLAIEPCKRSCLLCAGPDKK